MHILLTRPRADSEALADALRTLGDAVTVEPMLEIVEAGEAPPLDGIQAILATSANGIRALAKCCDRRDLPVFAVGDATAESARAAGFTRVESAQGASAALFRLVTERLRPADGALLHVRGRDVAGDLAASLNASGFEVRTAVLYAAEATTALSPMLRERLSVGEIDAVLFFSPRAARTFVNLVRDANMAQACAAIDAVCLSPAVADAASGVVWRAVRVAASPDQAAMIEERNRMQNDRDSDPSAKSGASGGDAKPQASDPAAGRSGADKPSAGRSQIPPSTLEKAVARDAETRKEEDSEKAAPSGGTKPAEPARGVSSHRTVFGVIAGLAVLLVLAGVWISWPAWGPALPGWLHASIAPVMDAGRGAGASGRVDELTNTIAGLERDIASLRSALESRPTVDPGKIAAIEEAARAGTERLGAVEKDLAAVRGSIPDSGPSEEIASLARRLGEAESRIAALAAEPGTKEAVAALDTLRTQSSARMTVLEKENDALRKLIALQDQRLATLEKRPAAVAGTTRTSALVIAVGQLRESARGTAPFGEALDAVAALAADDGTLQPEIETLKPLAASGVPDLTALRLRFDGISARIASESFVPGGDGWIDRTLQQLSRLVTVKRSGSEAAARDDENGRVARAELRLAAGDLEGAVAALDGLTGRAAEIAAPWLEAAQARLIVDRAVGRMFTEALRRTGATGRDSTGG